MSAIKTLLTLLTLLLISLIAYSFFKKTNLQEKPQNKVIHIKQLSLPSTHTLTTSTIVSEEAILSNLEQHIHKNKPHTDVVKETAKESSEEIKVVNSQKEIIKNKNIVKERKNQHTKPNVTKQAIGIFSEAYKLKENEKNLRYGEVETVSVSESYYLDDVAPIHEPIDVSTQHSERSRKLDFVQTLGVVDVSDTYLSTDDVM